MANFNFSFDSGALTYKDANGNEAALSMGAIAPAFSATSTYAKDALVTYGGKLYAAKANIGTAGPWDASKWTETTVAALLAS